MMQRVKLSCLLLLVLIVSSLAYEYIFYPNNPNGKQELDDAYLLNDKMEGLKQNCTTLSDEGPNWKSLFIYCLTPANNRFRVILANRRNRVGLVYNKKNSQFSCEELNIAKPYFENFLIPDERGNIQLDQVSIEDMKLSSEGLACVLKVFDAKGVGQLLLHGVMGVFNVSHVRGLGDVAIIQIRHEPNDKHPMSVYDVLSPGVERALIEYGALELIPTRSTFPALRYMLLEMGNITSLARGTFRNAPNLDRIELPNNNIQYIDADAFEGLSKLRILDLRTNSLSVLPDEVFRHARNIRRLTLSENSLTELTPGVFAGLSRLELVSVKLNKVDLKLHDRTFAGKRTLLELDLESSRIRSLPADIFRDDSRLQKIILSDNKITELPRTLFSSLQLNSLLLNNNSITHWPVGLFADLTQLKHLNLENNLIQTFDDLLRDFYDLKSLTNLVLSGNRIQTLRPAMFDFMPLLQELSLQNNDLTISPSHNVYPATDVYLSDQSDKTFVTNKLGWYSPFQNLKRLNTLNLRGNNISVMCTDWRASLSLKMLDLSHNSITTLESEDMHFRSHPTVDLRSNKIEYFDPYVYEADRPTPKFIMKDNPYNCSCSFIPFKKKYSLKDSTNLPNLELSGAMCTEPADVRGTNLQDITTLPMEECKKPLEDLFPPGSGFTIENVIVYED